MLAMLRTSRRVLAGAFGLLVLTSWLSVAAAACMGAAAPMAAPVTIDHAGIGHHAVDSPASQSMTMAMTGDGDCPHCTTAEAPCMENSSDCDVPAAIMPPQPEQPDFTALVDFPAEIPARIESAPHFVPHGSPPPRSGRELRALYCSFQE